jgi:hypothetical protein
MLAGARRAQDEVPTPHLKYIRKINAISTLKTTVLTAEQLSNILGEERLVARLLSEEKLEET